jgi:signal transduction histidine kinase
LQNSSTDVDQSYSKVQQLLKKLNSEVKHRMAAKKLTFSATASPKTGELVVNESILHEILSNLIVNAVQYTPDGGAIAITAEHSAESLTIAVSDTGIGIPKSYIPDMFKQFSRAENALSAFPDGTGLGLYMIKILLDKVSGTIICDSEVGVGTTFTVCVPLVKIQQKHDS